MAKTLSYPPKLADTNTNPAWISLQFYERKSPKSSPPDDTINLYMPEGASQPSTVSWDTEKFGFVGNAVTGGSGVMDTAVGAAWAAAARGKANLQASIANRMGGRLSADAIMSNTGKVPNPYLTMLFKGVDFRSFAFNFKFFPTTERDSDLIHDIITTLRTNAVPDFASEYTSAFLGYPKEVEISYMWKGDKNPYLHKFKRSVITGIDVDYTPNGMFAVMRNGMPACISVNLKFSEIELVLRKDIQEGY